MREPYTVHGRTTRKSVRDQVAEPSLGDCAGMDREGPATFSSWASAPRSCSCNWSAKLQPMSYDESEEEVNSSNDPAAAFAACMAARDFLSAVDLVPALPAERGKSASAVVEAALEDSGLDAADAVMQRFLETGYVPTAVGLYLARVYLEYGIDRARAFVEHLRASGAPLSPRAASMMVSAVPGMTAQELLTLLGDLATDPVLGSAVVRLFAKTDQVDDALALVTAMLAAKSDPSIDALRSIVNVLVTLERHDDAVGWISQLAESGVPQLPGGTLIGELVALGRTDSAERVLAALITGGRTLESYHVLPLVKAYQRRGDQRAASRLIEVARQAGLQLALPHQASDGTRDAAQIEARLVEQINGGSIPRESEFGKAVAAWGRAGEPERAEQVFELLSTTREAPSPASYGTVMAAWRRARRPDRVQYWFDEMRKRGMTPNERHIGALLHSYREADLADQAEALAQSLRDEGLAVSNRSPLHTHLEAMVRRNQQPEVTAFVELVRSYASAGEPEAAEEAFEWADELGLKLGFAGWDALYSAWDRAGGVNETTAVIERMVQDGYAPTDAHLISLAGHQTRAGNPTTAGGLRKQLVHHPAPGVESNRTALHTIASADNPDAESLASALRDIVSLGDFDLAVQFLRLAAKAGNRLDVVGVRRLLVAARKNHNADAAVSIFRLFNDVGVEPDDIDFNEVMRSLADAGRAAECQSVFDELRCERQPNGFHFQSLLRAYQEAGRLVELLQIFADGPGEGVPRNSHHFGTAINAAATLNDADAALALLDEMISSDIAPNSLDVDAVLSAFRWEQAEQMQAVVDRLSESDVVIDEHHIHRLMRAWRMSGGLSGVQDAFDSLAVHQLRPNAFHFAELIGAHLDARDADATVPLMQRALDTGMVDQRLLSVFVIETSRLQRTDLADWAIEEAATSGVRPDSSAVATLMIAKRRSGIPVAAGVLESALGETARLASAEEVKHLARSLAREGAVDELVVLRNSVTDDALDLEIAAELVIAHAITSESERVEVAYADVAPRAEDLDVRTLQAVVGALCRANCPRAALDAFQRLATRGAPSSRTVGAVMDVLTPVAAPAEIEAILRNAQRTTPLAPREHGILFNLVLRAYARAQLHDEVLRLRDEMVELGLPIDRYTLGPVQRVLDEQDVLGADDRRLRDGQSGIWDELGVLLDDVIHELTGPTMRIGGITKRLRAHARDSADVELSATVSKLVAASDALVDRLAEYAVLAQADAQDAVFDVRDVLRWTVARTEQRASAARVVVQTSVSSGESSASFQLQGQAAFFRIAMRALVSNAIEALATSPGERRVWLTAMHTAAPPSAGWVDIYVRDNGPGIPPDVRSRVFERGFTTKDSRGLGLGLSLVESVAALFGGSVTLTDSMTGAEFFLRFPAAALRTDLEID